MLYENFISNEEQENLRDWAYKEECRLRPNGNGLGRFFNQVTNLTKNELVYTIKDRIIKKFNLYGWEDDPSLGDWLGMQKDGAYINFHTDKLPIGEHHRFNVLIQLPHKGGINIYNGEELAVKERMLINYRPDLYEHGTTKVVGDRPRINLSFGFASDVLKYCPTIPE
jgi:hypothetical protein